jgi:uncharacterized protein (TIGR03790 family)
MRRTLLLLVLLAPPALALEPKDVFVVANKDSAESVAVARHYLDRRKVPKENLIELSLPTGEDISRADYDAKLAGPLREALKGKKDACKVLLTVYGVPLRVGPQLPSKDEQAELDGYKPALDLAKMTLEGLEKEKAEAGAVAAARKKVADLDLKVVRLSYDQSQAAVDSELMLLWWPKYDTTRFLQNPLYWRVGDAVRKAAPPVLLTARLDGPTPDIARRLVDDAIDTEAKGLSGKAYLDARGLKWDPTAPAANPTGYEAYDESFREAAAVLTTAGMDVTLDDKGPVFAANTCPDAAVYAGWYSANNYIDSCTFAKGAVAWHLASFEATTLRDPKAKAWCPNLLKKGAAATLGPVAEPYTFGFPKPAEFFGFLASGEYTLVECYARSALINSWMMTLVGDPLYKPFKPTGKVKAADVTPSPKGVR